MDRQEPVSVLSAPATPGTPGIPGAPLFGGFNGDRNTTTKKSLFSRTNNCFKVETRSIEEGNLPAVSCTMIMPPPPVPLAKKEGLSLATLKGLSLTGRVKFGDEWKDENLTNFLMVYFVHGLMPTQVIAEFIGTFILIFAGTASAIVNQKTQGSETLIGLAASGGLAVMIVILSTGHISGAHLNPSITIAFAALKHFPWAQVPAYIGAQVLASFCAAFVTKSVFYPIMGGGVTVPAGHNYGQAFALEFIITFILMFVVTAVATDTRAVGELAGIAVGATVMLNILIAGPVTGASMNLARTLGPAVAANNFKAIWIYLIAPILGALCGAGVYTAVKLPEEEENNLKQPSAATSFRR